MQERGKISIRFKFLASAVFVLVVTVGSMSAIEVVALRGAYLKSLQDQSCMAARGIRATLYKNLEYFPLEGLSGMSGYLRGLAKEYENISHFYVTDGDGLVLYHDKGPAAEGGHVDPLKEVFGPKDASGCVMTKTGAHYEIAIPVIKGNNVVGTVRVDVALRVVDDAVRKIIIRNIALFVLMVIFAVALMYFVFTMGIARPIARIATKLAALSSHLGLDVDLREGGDLDPEDMATSFELIADGLERKTVSEEYVDSVLKGMSDALFVTDNRGIVRMANKMASSLSGYAKDELHGKNIEIFFGDEDRARLGLDGKGIMPAGPENKSKAYDVKFLSRDGKTTPVLVSVLPVTGEDGEMRGSIWTTKDISSIKETEDELKRLNEELRKNEKAVLNILADLKKSHEELKESQAHLVRTEKLVSLGRLVSDMAHEVNNPLMIISGRAQLAMMEGTTPQEVQENFRIIVDQCMRAKEIIERLLIFSRPSKGKETETDINQSLEFVAKLLEHQYSLVNIKILKDYAADLPRVMVDEKQMHEVFMNLIKNAAEAMPHGGTITLSTRAEKSGLIVDISDTGMGIPEKIIGEIMDPFFTTKEHGTGLGLAVCYGIMKAHDGDLKVKSEVGKGTTVSVILPR